MDLTGPIFALIALAWLAYLVPVVLRRRAAGSGEIEDVRPFTDSVQVVHAAVREEDVIDETLDVSTPMTRSARRYQLVVAERVAARRRRRVVGFFGLTFLALVVTSALHRTPWWTVVVPAVLLLAFLAVARVSVRRMYDQLDRRARAIDSAGDDEPTICLELLEQADEREVEISAPIPFVGSLWDPVPVTRATYVQKPLAPRTVRTIDLSAPTVHPAVPPTAEAPETEPVRDAAAAHGDTDDLPRAVGE